MALNAFGESALRYFLFGKFKTVPDTLSSFPHFEKIGWSLGIAAFPIAPKSI